jgi:hypothetical protein
LTHDCPSDGSNAGAVLVNLSPVTTTAQTESSQTRIFCPAEGQNSDDLGCFQNGLQCRRIQVAGAPAGTIPLNTPTAIKLASIFCVSQTTNATVNFSADLPGPGATVIVGNFKTLP